MTPERTSGRSRPRDLPVLTSLRFVAAMMIVVRHLHAIVPGLVPGDLIELTHGVSFFFVLSGFILTHSCIGDPSIGWRDFMVRRLARIVPCHLFGFGLALCLPAAMLFLPNVSSGDEWLVLILKFFLLDSFMTNLDAAFSLNGPSWSLSTELFFSLAFLPLLRGVVKAPWTVFALSLLAAWSLIAGLRASGIPETAAVDPRLNVVAIIDLNPFVRVTEFIFGMALYTFWRRYLDRNELTAVVWSAIEVAATLFVLAWFAAGFRIGYSVLPEALRDWFMIAGSAPVLGLFILLMAGGRGVIGRMLATPPCVWLGRISFAVYISHYVVLKLVVAHGGPVDRLAPILVALVVIGAVLHAFVETPAQRLMVRYLTSARTTRRESDDQGRGPVAGGQPAEGGTSPAPKLRRLAPVAR